jgi:hypothetical protein
LPRRVPDLQPNDGGGIDIDDALRQERCAYRRLCRGRRESVLYVAVHEGRLAYALAAEHDNLRFKTVRHGGSSAVATLSVLAVVLFSRAVGERCRRVCLCLIKAGGDCFGGQRREVNAGQIAWRAVKKVAQTTEAALTDCDVKVPVPACSRRLSGTAEEEPQTSAFGR